jgi:hypothetical protein
MITVADAEIDTSRLAADAVARTGHPERVENGRSAETPIASPDMRDRLDAHRRDHASNA